VTGSGADFGGVGTLVRSNAAHDFGAALTDGGAGARAGAVVVGVSDRVDVKAGSDSDEVGFAGTEFDRTSFSFFDSGFS
jgi:hypothetical protein